MPKIRLDLLVVERGLADSRARAQALIMAGRVRVDDQVVLKPSSATPPEARLQLASGPRFVSRGGEKLDAALSDFGVDVTARVCADVGASTGGFTDCLLQRGAAKVYAIDVGRGILDWKLRNDPRVVVMEAVNARHLESLPEGVSLVTIDASFISLRILLPVVKGWLSPSPHLTGLPPSPSRSTPLGTPGGEIVALIKPQFEAGKIEARHGGGVIRDPVIHRRVLLEVLTFAEQEGLHVRGLIRSPLLGPKGNAEFLARLSMDGETSPRLDALVEGALIPPARPEAGRE